MTARWLPALLGSVVLAAAGGLDGCRCACSGGSGGTLSTPTVHNVATSPECDGVCKKIEACGTKCDRDDKCKIERGKCAASTRALLRCEAEKGTFTCLPGSAYAMTSPCVEDATLCTGADADTTKVPESP